MKNVYPSMLFHPDGGEKIARDAVECAELIKRGFMWQDDMELASISVVPEPQPEKKKPGRPKKVAE